MDIQLARPLAVFDIESTGVNAEHDRIVEIAVLKIQPDGTSRSNVRRVNPEMPIPPSATAVHGISDADVAGCPPFAEIAPKLADYLSPTTSPTAISAATTSSTSTCRCWKTNSAAPESPSAWRGGR